ncbi:MAG: tripartite tricarboxylate transporter permease [bacterium]|jgi:putative tricarboxylic transport membrane protein
MSTLELIGIGFANVFQPFNFLVICFGLAVGIVAAALPGISGTMAVVLLIPLTFGMTPIQGIVMLSSLYLGAQYGGSITAILLKIPGTSAAAATTLDGYPMAQKGQAGKALGGALMGSTVGGIFGTILLFFCVPPLARMAIEFGSAQYFALAIFGLSVVTSLTSKNLAKGFVAMFIGLFIGTVGIDSITGTARFTFGVTLLRDGIHFVPLLIGLFAVAEVFNSVASRIGQPLPSREATLQLPSLKEMINLKSTILRSSSIGTFIGALPGAGGTIASFIAYNEAVRWSKEPEKFGTGVLEGVVAPESANNAAAAGAMIPLLALGIPGSATTAVMLGAFQLHGIRPGPMLLTQNADLVYTVFVGMFITNFILLAMGVYGVKLFARAVLLRYEILGPVVLILASVGSFAIRGSLLDIQIMFIAGILGYLMDMAKFPMSPIVLGVILGPMAEAGLRRALIVTRGSMLPILTDPIVFILLLLSALSFLSPFISEMLKKRGQGRTA